MNGIREARFGVVSHREERSCGFVRGARESRVPLPVYTRGPHGPEAPYEDAHDAAAR